MIKKIFSAFFNKTPEKMELKQFSERDAFQAARDININIPPKEKDLNIRLMGFVIDKIPKFTQRPGNRRQKVTLKYISGPKKEHENVTIPMEFSDTPLPKGYYKYKFILENTGLDISGQIQISLNFPNHPLGTDGFKDLFFSSDGKFNIDEGGAEKASFIKLSISKLFPFERQGFNFITNNQMHPEIKIYVEEIGFIENSVSLWKVKFGKAKLVP